ncbi:condensation domain-containing protein, partial [Bacillus thuringiensis]|uniref:condensation domain-containing protein n=1 Tax=Bacillus thuringiensis TaxID=1428 RepID=UPI002156172E
MSFEYCSDLFKESSIHQMMEHYVQILRGIIQNPEQKIVEINVVSEVEKEKILGGFNDTTVRNPKDMTVITRFEEQVRRVPDKIAVRAAGREITYRELNEKANQLA